MRLLVLGGTLFLGRHVVDAALAAGHEVATFTRGRTGTPPPEVRDLRGDREDPAAVAAALADWPPDCVVDTSCQSRAAADAAAGALADRGAPLAGYAFTSSLNAYRGWPPGPLRTDDDPTWDVDPGSEQADEYGPVKAHAERVLTARVPGPVLLARAGLVLGPLDPVYRLGWWLDRVARGGRVVVPSDALDVPMAVVDARDLAAWLLRGAAAGWAGGVNATGPVGMTTLRGLLGACVAATGGDVEFVGFGDEALLAAGVEPWTQLPLWFPGPDAAALWDVATERARELGLASRPVTDTVADTWAWQAATPHRPPVPAGMPAPGLPPEVEARLLGGGTGRTLEPVP